MQRRKFVIGMGALASGAAAGIGSGAFDSVSAQRDITVNTAGDASAYVAIEPETGDNATEYVDDSGDTVGIKLTTTEENGTGLNKNAETIIRDLLKITNQGTQDVIAGFTNIPDGMSFYTDDDKFGDAGSSMNADSFGPDNLPAIPVGETLNRVGLIVRDPEKAANNDGSVTLLVQTEDEF
ncbi:hypothetical protein [Natrinema limicola]|uniref:DUF1102 domain-containing protein n=1 Tax=Natrinema limicola JCM 13563 TaxID=1230457 RepID=M0C4Z2_9EURY|nr:hypothetical protein [Natrinema limicola]ELZ17387.1 hypothetical protein C476_15565 [Natrinema limicola JCM 13563]